MRQILLPDECLNELLLYLDNKTLYKCLFVNRNYCRYAIPILWERPFKPSFMNSKHSLIINTLLNCLDKEEITTLIPFQINITENRTPLFEYGKFIKIIDQEFVKQNIITWLNSTNGKVLTERYNIAKYQDIRVKKLINVIYHMIIRQGSNLKELNLRIIKD
ncbi:uncharacterized protein OCT59_005657 [Rhizophagus irregularis]|uniref:uncharacterized protein n=1 Tax=Rhizophagus irregularis TaxID=588596 RepID=UPI0033277B27|nr:hypothetical protein OCT59_005657 [Rhizophagus irregularis]